MAVTRQSQEQRGQDTNIGQSSRAGEQRSLGQSTRRSVDGARTTESTGLAKSFEAPGESIQTQREHADVMVRFRIVIDAAYHPEKRYE